MKKVAFSVILSVVLFPFVNTPVFAADFATEITGETYEKLIDEAMNVMLELQLDDHAPCIMKDTVEREMHCEGGGEYDFYIYEKDAGGIEIQIMTAEIQETELPGIWKSSQTLRGSIVAHGILRQKVDRLFRLVSSFHAGLFSRGSP